MHTFAGILDTSTGASHGGFRVKVYMDEDKLEIASSDGESWLWHRDQVDIGRVRADQFRLTLDGEQLYFSPDDPIDFTLKATSGEASAVEPKQGWLRKQLEAAMADGSPVEESTFEASDDAGGESKGRFGLGRRHRHSWVESTAGQVVRRRCTSCGHVSIDVSGVRADLASQV